MAVRSERLHTESKSTDPVAERARPRLSALLLYIGLVCSRYPTTAVAYIRERILYRMALANGAAPVTTRIDIFRGVLRRSKQKLASLLPRIARFVWWHVSRPWRMHSAIVGKIAGQIFNECLDARHDPTRAAMIDRLTQSSLISGMTMAILTRRAARLGRMDISTRAARNIRERFPRDLILLRQAGLEAFLGGDYRSAEDLWGAWHSAREAEKRKRGLAAYEPIFLGATWYAAVGHIAHLDTYFKWRILTGGERKVAFNVPRGTRVPNTDLLNRWRNYLGDRLVDAAPYNDALYQELIQDEFWGLPVGNGGFRMFSHAGAWVQSEWERHGWRPLLSLTQADHERAAPLLSALGLPSDAWYACLHVREPGFHEAWHKTNPGTRNADIDNYIQAAEAVVARGGYVVRMGDPSMKRIGPTPGVVDYAHNSEKCDFLDVYLSASCKFFIGTNSGLALVPPVFGVPCALTNWAPLGLPQWYQEDLFIPKLCFSERLGRHLTFREMLASNAGWSQFQDYFTSEAIRIEDNSPEDIRDLVVEMLDREDGITSHENASDVAMRDVFEKLALEYGSYRGSKIGAKFMRKYGQWLLAEQGISKPERAALSMD